MHRSHATDCDQRATLLISSSKAVGRPTKPCTEPHSQTSESCPDPESQHADEQSTTRRRDEYRLSPAGCSLQHSLRSVASYDKILTQLLVKSIICIKRNDIYSYVADLPVAAHSVLRLDNDRPRVTYLALCILGQILQFTSNYYFGKA